MTDDEIADALHRTHDAVRDFPARAEASKFFAMHMPVEPGAYAGLLELVNAHDLFHRKGNRYFGSKIFHFEPEHAARLLLNKAQQIDAADAVAWLRKVYTATHADIRYVAEVIGIHLAGSYQLSNGVQFMPISELPKSLTSDLYKFEHKPGGWFTGVRYKIAAVHELRSIPGLNKSPSISRTEQIERAVQAHVLLDEDAAPVVGNSWVEFTDPEMEDANYALMGLSMSPFDGPIRSPWAIPMTAELVPQVDAILLLDKSIQEKIDTAASRLIMARSRRSPNNRAIDGCICLEALLSDRQPGEHTYKLALRAALLLGKDIEDRREIRKTVEAFYKLRSSAVHGTRSNTISEDSTNADAGLKLCARILSAIVTLNSIPDWRVFELGAELHNPKP